MHVCVERHTANLYHCDHLLLSGMDSNPELYELGLKSINKCLLNAF